MAAHHDCEFGAWSSVLPFDGGVVEDNSECTLGVLLERDGLWNQVAEAFHGEEIGVLEVEVDGHDGDVGSEILVAQCRYNNVVVFSRLVGVGLGMVSSEYCTGKGETYACDDLNLLLFAFDHFEGRDRTVELDLDIAGFLHSILQPSDEGL